MPSWMAEASAQSMSGWSSVILSTSWALSSAFSRCSASWAMVCWSSFMNRFSVQATNRAIQAVARHHRHQGRLRAREDDVAGLEAYAQPPQRVGQPGHGVDGRALHRGAARGADDLAVLLQHHAGQGEVDVARAAAQATEREHAAGG